MASSTAIMDIGSVSRFEHTGQPLRTDGLIVFGQLGREGCHERLQLQHLRQINAKSMTYACVGPSAPRLECLQLQHLRLPIARAAPEWVQIGW